jgi:voltage-gated potassium channel
MLTWGWLDLLSSIPALPWMRWGRAGRVVRILRVLRGIRAARMLTGLLLHRRVESAVFGTLLLFLLVLVVGSVSVLQFEREAQANIVSAEDALWWAFVTMTTVGYGDRYPVTTEGRIVAAVLMSAGVGLFGTFSGLIASFVLRQGSQESQETAATEHAVEADRLAAIESELRSLRKLLETRAGQPPVPSEGRRDEEATCSAS